MPILVHQRTPQLPPKAFWDTPYLNPEPFALRTAPPVALARPNGRQSYHRESELAESLHNRLLAATQVARSLTSGVPIRNAEDRLGVVSTALVFEFILQSRPVPILTAKSLPAETITLSYRRTDGLSRDI